MRDRTRPDKAPGHLSPANPEKESGRRLPPPSNLPRRGRATSSLNDNHQHRHHASTAHCHSFGDSKIRDAHHPQIRAFHSQYSVSNDPHPRARGLWPSWHRLPCTDGRPFPRDCPRAANRCCLTAESWAPSLRRALQLGAGDGNAENLAGQHAQCAPCGRVLLCIERHGLCLRRLRCRQRRRVEWQP